MSESDDNDKNQSCILEEEIDADYEPSQKEIKEYARYLGMDIKKDQQYFYLAREGLKAPICKPWKPYKNSKGEIYYINLATKEKVDEHPCDILYKKKFQQIKLNEKKLIEEKIKQDNEIQLKQQKLNVEKMLQEKLMEEQKIKTKSNILKVESLEDLNQNDEQNYNLNQNAMELQRENNPQYLMNPQSKLKTANPIRNDCVINNNFTDQNDFNRIESQQKGNNSMETNKIIQAKENTQFNIISNQYFEKINNQTNDNYQQIKSSIQDIIKKNNINFGQDIIEPQVEKKMKNNKNIIKTIFMKEENPLDFKSESQNTAQEKKLVEKQLAETNPSMHKLNIQNLDLFDEKDVKNENEDASRVTQNQQENYDAQSKIDINLKNRQIQDQNDSWDCDSIDQNNDESKQIQKQKVLNKIDDSYIKIQATEIINGKQQELIKNPASPSAYTQSTNQIKNENRDAYLEQQEQNQNNLQKNEITPSKLQNNNIQDQIQNDMHQVISEHYQESKKNQDFITNNQNDNNFNQLKYENNSNFSKQQQNQIKNIDNLPSSDFVPNKINAMHQYNNPLQINDKKQLLQNGSLVKNTYVFIRKQKNDQEIEHVQFFQELQQQKLLKIDQNYLQLRQQREDIYQENLIRLKQQFEQDHHKKILDLKDEFENYQRMLKQKIKDAHEKKQILRQGFKTQIQNNITREYDLQIQEQRLHLNKKYVEKQEQIEENEQNILNEAINSYRKDSQDKFAKRKQNMNSQIKQIQQNKQKQQNLILIKMNQINDKFEIQKQMIKAEWELKLNKFMDTYQQDLEIQLYKDGLQTQYNEACLTQKEIKNQDSFKQNLKQKQIQELNFKKFNLKKREYQQIFDEQLNNFQMHQNNQINENLRLQNQALQDLNSKSLDQGFNAKIQSCRDQHDQQLLLFKYDIEQKYLRDLQQLKMQQANMLINEDKIELQRQNDPKLQKLRQLINETQQKVIDFQFRNQNLQKQIEKNNEDRYKHIHPSKIIGTQQIKRVNRLRRDSIDNNQITKSQQNQKNWQVIIEEYKLSMKRSDLYQKKELKEIKQIHGQVEELKEKYQSFYQSLQQQKDNSKSFQVRQNLLSSIKQQKNEAIIKMNKKIEQSKNNQSIFIEKQKALNQLIEGFNNKQDDYVLDKLVFQFEKFKLVGVEQISEHPNITNQNFAKTTNDFSFQLALKDQNQQFSKTLNFYSTRRSSSQLKENHQNDITQNLNDQKTWLQDVKSRLSKQLYSSRSNSVTSQRYR